LYSGKGVKQDEIPEDCITAVYSIQKLTELVRRGDDTQILFALGELKQLLEHCLDDARTLFIPAICENVPTWTQELQLKAGRELVLLEKYGMSSELGRVLAFAALLVIRDTNNITTSSAAQLYEFYGRVGSLSIPMVDWNTEDLSCILRFVDQYAESPFSEERRVAVSFSLGLCQCKASELNVARQGFSRLWPLSSDPSLDVLAKCLEVIGNCAGSFSDLVVVERVWPLIHKAWEIESTDVTSYKSLLARASAVKCASQLCEERFLNRRWGRSEARATENAAILGILTRLLAFATVWSQKDQRELAKEVYIAEIAVAENIVKLIYYALQGPKDPRNALSLKSAVAVYSQLVQSNGPEIREKCAYNMPGMACIARTDKSSRAILTTCCGELAFDGDDVVRIALSKGFHETVRALCSRANVDKLKGILVDLAEDDSIFVKNAIFSHLTETLVALTKFDKSICGDEIRAIVQTTAHSLPKAGWRMSQDFALQAGSICKAFPTLGLEDSIVPLLLAIVDKTGPTEVRVSAANTIVTITRTIPIQAKRDKYVTDLISSLTGGSHLKRITAIECSVHALDVYSEVIFSELFATAVLSLAQDSVPNVRIRLAQALPRLAPWCQAHEIFESSLASLRADPDPDVQEVMRSYVQKASKYVSLSRDAEKAEHSRRVEEIRYYSGGASSSSGGRVARQLTPRSLPGPSAIAAGIGAPLLQVAQQPARLGRMIASLTASSRGSAHEEEVAATAVAEEITREAAKSAARPAVECAAGLSLESHVSAISFTSDSCDHFVQLQEEGVAPAHAVAARNERTSVEGAETAGKTGISFSAMTSGSLGSFGEPSSGKIAKAFTKNRRSGTTLQSSRLSRGISSERRSSSDALQRVLPKPKINAQALPVQKLARKFQGRRSSVIRPRALEKPHTRAFSNDSTLLSNSSEVPPLEEAPAVHSITLAEGDNGKEDMPVGDKVEAVFEGKVEVGDEETVDAVVEDKEGAVVEDKVEAVYEGKVEAVFEDEEGALVEDKVEAVYEGKVEAVFEDKVEEAVEDEDEGEYDILRIDIPASSPTARHRNPTLFEKISSRFPISWDMYSRQASRGKKPVAGASPSPTQPGDHSTRQASNAFSYYTQEGAPEEAPRVNSRGKILMIGLAHGLRALARKRRGARAGAGRMRRTEREAHPARGEHVSINSEIAFEEENTEIEPGPEEYVPKFGGSSPPCMRQRLADEKGIAAASALGDGSSADEARKTRSLDADRVAPGTVASLLRRWESVEAVQVNIL
jgi:hypothetical protein